MSLRLKLYMGFGVIAALVIVLGSYGARSAWATGELVAGLFDEPLIGVSYARAASAALNRASDLMARALSAEPAASPEFVAALNAAEADIAEDLRVVRSRVRDPAVTEANNLSVAGVAAWLHSGRLILAPPANGVTALPMRSELERQRATATARLDDLVENVTAFGFTYRARAKQAIYRSNLMLAALSGVIIAVTAVFAVLFSRSIIRPIRTATSIAESVAAGRIARIDPGRRCDEVGRLLRSLATMQANLRDRARRAEVLLQAKDRTAEALRQINLRFDLALENMKHGLAFFDHDAGLIVCNRVYRELYGLSPEQTKPGATHFDILGCRMARGSFPDMTIADYQLRREELAKSTESYIEDALRDGRTIAVHYKTLPNGAWVSTHEDITERRLTEAHLAFVARHDALTRLPNRVLFHERLEEAVRMTGRETGCALLLIDLDDFALINDTRGHSFGDAVLIAAADRLQACVRDVDTVARLGGDEFAIIQVAIDQTDDSAIVANRIVEAFRIPLNVDGSQIVVGLSIGVAVAPADGNAATQFQKNADVALYRAKQDGRGTVRFFQLDMDTLVQFHRALALELEDAIARNQFEVYYQPLINLATDRVTGFEALLRWHHPVRGSVSPSDFIPVAEETGKIIAIGEWVLRTACFEAQTWPADIHVAVNLSPVQFKKGDLVGMVKAALNASGLRPDRLQLEITEMVKLQETAATVAVLHQLRAMGIAVALDDFGTGYSSLSYLNSFPFDKIKIDQSFIRNMVSNAGSVSIIRAITGLGQSLGIRTTAEGVETREQMDRLRDEGCTEAQGNLLSRPRPAREIPALIERLQAVSVL